MIYVKNVKRLRSGAVINESADGLVLCSPHIFCKGKASVFQTMLWQGCFWTIKLRKLNLLALMEISVSPPALWTVGNWGIRCDCIGARNEERFEKRKEALVQLGVTLQIS